MIASESRRFALIPERHAFFSGQTGSQLALLEYEYHTTKTPFDRDTVLRASQVTNPGDLGTKK